MDDEEFLKLSIEEKCQHKSWKARVSGYEEATRLFQQQDEKSPEFSKYLGLVKKFVIDNNVVAQEKGLNAVLAFVENAACAGKTSGDVMSGIISKCFGAPKVKTKELALEIVLMYIEIEKQEIVQDELVKGLENKSPKVVATSIIALREALRLFGPQVITVKPLMKLIPKLLEDRDKLVRDEAKLLCTEVYRWFKDAIKPQLQSLKPVQLSELEKDFEKVANEKASAVRFLRSQQEIQMKNIAEANCQPDNEENCAEPQPKVDPYDFMDPVDILSKLPKDFYEQCEAKKWQERKEALETLQNLVSSPKLESGDYGDLIRILKKMIAKDTNILVVSLAGKCLAGLATGLRKKFQPFAAMCFPVILEKFKEKKQNVIQALREAADAIYNSTTLEVIIEDVQAALDNKNPQVKTETAAFLARCFSHCTPIQLNKKMLKPLCSSLIKTLNDTDSTVRDASAEALGTALKVVGEKVMNPFLQEVDALKMAKVKDCSDKAVVTVSASQAVSDTKVTVKPPTAVTSAVNGNSDVKATSAVTRKATSVPTLTTKSKTGLVPRGNKKMPGVKKPTESVTPEFSEKELSDEDIASQISVLFPDDSLHGLGSSNWKERLAAAEKFQETVQQMDKASIPSQVLIRTLAKKPGFKENNFQILKLKFEILVYIVEHSPVSRCTIDFCLSDLVDKLGDPKNGSAAGSALSAFADAVELEYISQEVLRLAFCQKNPKNQSEALLWLSNAIKEFGLKVQVKDVIDNIKKGLSSTNPTVRNSALALLKTLYLYVGRSVRTFFDDEKPSLLQQIDSELEKVKDAKPPIPIRGSSEKTRAPSSERTDPVESFPVSASDLLPRADISGLITSSLLADMADKNWKVRDEALQKISSIINDAKFITPNLGDLPSALKNRLSDTNRNLAIQALNICHTLGTSLGPHCTKHIRLLGPGMLTALGDNKANVRSTALQCVKCWVEQCGLPALFEGETVATALKSDNPYLRIELLGWLAEKLPEVSSIPSSELIPCISPILACLEDRNNEVRKKAQEILLPFTTHVGYDAVSRAANKLKPASKNIIMAHLDKIRPNLPEKIVKPKVIGKGGSSVSSSLPSTADNDENAGALATKSKLNHSASKSKLAAKASSIPSAKSSKKDEEVDTSPPLVINNMKDQRMIDEKALRVLRWNFTTPREEFYVQLKDQMTAANWGRTFVTNCFHNDFKFHLKAIDILIECLSNSLEATTCNLDLILKWLALRFFDTNPSVLIRGLEYLQQLFEALIGCNYRILDAEASSFIPYLIIKMGDPKDTVRKGVREIIKLMCQIYPSSKIFSYIMQGLPSKNARQRAECLEELGCMIESYGLCVCQPSPAVALKEIARQISDRDNSVRNASLNCVVQAYFLEGEKVYKYVGHLAEKDMSLLEERIKRSAKTRSMPQRDIHRDTNITSPPINKSPPTHHPSPSGHSDIPEVVHRVSKGNIPRPRSTGPLTLDVDDIEQMFKTKEPETKILEPVKVNADEILNLPDIQLPQTKLRPPASAVKLLNNSEEVNIALNLVMSQLAAQEVPVVVEAFAQIDEVLRDDRAESVLGARVDQLLVMGALQYRLAHNKHMADENICKAEVIRLYRCVTMTLLSLFDNNALAKKASRDVLRDLIPHLITVLQDSRLNELQEGPHVVRSINVLIVRILQRANASQIMSALIKLLHDCVGNMNASERFTELVMKCLWKMLRIMNTYIDELDIDRILLDLHVFLKAYPSSSWKDRPSDTPIRTVKTTIYTLINHKGEDIMNHLMLIPNKQESDLVTYIQKILHLHKDGDRRRDKRASGRSHDHDGTREVGSSSRKSKSSPMKLSKSNHEALTEIFKKIGSKEHTKEGLLELYEFMQHHPEANIEPFLQRSSEFFKNYIREGIKNIEQEKVAQGNLTQQPHGSFTLFEKTEKFDSHSNMKTSELALSNSHPKNSVTDNWIQGFPPIPPASEETTPMDWIEWLKIFVARLGMDTSKYDDPAFLQQLLKNIPDLTENNTGLLSDTEVESIFHDIEKLRHVIEDIKQQNKLNIN